MKDAAFRSTLNCAVIGVCIAFTLPNSSGGGEGFLDDQQVSVLQRLDSEAVRNTLVLAGQIQAWRLTIAEYKLKANGPLEVSIDLDGDTDDIGNLSTAVIEIARTIHSQKNVLKQMIDVGDTIDRQLSQIESAGSTVEIDDEFDVTREDLHVAARNLAEADAAVEIIDELEGILKLIEGFRNPAQFAKDFADREISQWLTQPREAGGVTFKILKTDPSKSLFSPEADIVIQMEYGPGIVVEAHGLYFKYVDAAPHFEAVLDQEKMKVTTNLQALGQAQITKAANELLATIDGPVTVKNFRFTDFGTRKAGLECRVEVNLGEILPLKAGGNVLLTTDGKLKWTEALDMTYPCNPPIPVGSTPLGIHDIHGAWNPQAKKAEGSDRQLKVGTTMSTVAAKTDEVIALNVNVAFDFPVKAVDIDGQVTLGRTSIGDVWGTLDLSKVEADAEFKIPGKGSAIPESVFAMTGKTKVTREGFDSVGNARLFGKDVDKSHLFIGTDGHGRFTAESCQVCGVNLAPNLEAGFKPGFSDVWVRAVYSVDVDLRLFRADATVMIEASKDHGIQVTARAMGSEATFSVDSLDQITPERIAEELLKHMDDMLQNIAAAAAKWEADKKELLAKWDSHWRESLHDEAKKHGLDKVDTGNPAVNQILGGISSDAKWSGGVVSDVWKKSGAEAADFVKDPAASLSSLPSNFGRELSNVAESATETIGNLFGGGGGGGGGSSGPDPATVRANELHAEVEKKLTPLVQACNAVHLAKKTASRPERSRERYFSETSEVRVQFENAVGVSRGKGSGLVGLTLAANGYRSRIHHGPESKVEQQDTSDVKGASIDFTSLVPQDKADLSEGEKQGSPKARIHVDQLADASGLNAGRRAHAKLQELVEQYLPEVEIEGPKMYYESQLAIENRTKEPIHVWVQTYSRALTNGALVWNWSPANPPAREAHRFTIKAGTTETLQIVSTYNAPAGDSTTDLAYATSKPLTGSRVRLWAESESGDRWMTHFDKDLSLVTPDPGLEETHGYFADQVRTFTHVIEPKSGTRIFDERLVVMTNKTKEPITVQLRYRATEGGATAWRMANDLTIPPGGSESPKTSEGMRVRASQVQFSARSDNFFFGTYSQTALALVGGADGQRLYHADKIGQFEHVFEAPVAKSNGSK